MERQTAYICKIGELLKGRFIKGEGFEANAVLTEHATIARANILGVVVHEETNAFMLDDGTGRVLVKSFEPLHEVPALGDVVQVIGKPRVYNDQFFIFPEIVKKIIDKRWIAYRQRVLELREKKVQRTDVEAMPLNQQIISFIKKNDAGNGVSLTDLKVLGDTDKMILQLLADGEIFEVKPGYVKVLD
ncbi:hypothetical protein C4573_00870 [Candidatus Woesearchaeota archaeon]|nr:MAG: hypothetical protein C4573_00870 [Candidatus Woesearchaeota archaeon]